MSDWMFETTTDAQPMMGDEPAMGLGGSLPWLTDVDAPGREEGLFAGKGHLTEFDLMPHNSPGDDDTTILPGIDVVGDRDVYDDPYDDWWETGGVPPGSGGSGGPSGDGGGSSVGGQAPALDTRIFAGEDCATGAITAEIDRRPTNDTAEHSAATYRDAQGQRHR